MGQRTWLVLIGGFTQAEHRPGGMLRLYQRLDQLRRPGVEISFRPWNCRWRRFARRMHLLGSELQVLLFAYSYGAGWGAVRLARRLQAHGTPIAHAVLSDPVARSRWLLPNLAAWLPRGWRFKPRIHMPANVRRITYFAQQHGPPYASPVRSDDPAVVPRVHLVSHVPHVAMDDLPAFHDACVAAAQQAVGRQRAAGCHAQHGSHSRHARTRRFEC
jgi:hypothetical protein